MCTSFCRGVEERLLVSGLPTFCTWNRHYSPHPNAKEPLRVHILVSRSKYPGTNPSSIPREHRYNPTNPQVDRMRIPTSSILHTKKNILGSYKSDPNKEKSPSKLAMSLKAENQKHNSSCCVSAANGRAKCSLFNIWTGDTEKFDN